MEQKRVLWIVAAVGLFLLVTIGTALIIYRPTQNQTPVLNSPQLSAATWTRESPAAEQSATPAQAAQTEAQQSVPASPVTPATPAADTPAQITNLTVISANTNVISDGTKTIDLNALTNNSSADASSQAAAPVQSSPATALATAEITVNTVTAPAAVASATVQQTTNTTSTTAAPAQTPVEKTVTATPAKTAKPAASSVKTVTSKIPDQFWVQAASFTKKVNAEEARDALAAEKIPGEVFTWKDANGVVYYRLRVGPYTTKSEADFWLSRIKEISAFASTSSYVVNSSEKASN